MKRIAFSVAVADPQRRSFLQAAAAVGGGRLAPALEADLGVAVLVVLARLLVFELDREDDLVGPHDQHLRAAPDADGWLIALADMPFVRPETIRAVLAALAKGAAIAAPSYRGERGHPVGFARAFYEELSTLKGDAGARELDTVQHAVSAEAAAMMT